MTAQHADLGDCPNCGAAVPSGQLLIEYEAEDGGGVWAECPDCSKVVDPKR
ncbi:hypothetical protein ACFQDG_12225 [Natronoarchaeum mannanilyticum]|uniref:DUF7837 family putative zinc-binding protein n=1 Tax=Natronoarchaeum mannanilyticum TaxID=926360 RepID=UPI0031D9B827